jgi:hypothetical protein
MAQNALGKIETRGCPAAAAIGQLPASRKGRRP